MDGSLDNVAGYRESATLWSFLKIGDGGGRGARRHMELDGCSPSPPIHTTRKIRPFASSAFFTAVSTTFSGVTDAKECVAGSAPE